MTNVLPISGVEHGRRTVMSAIDENMQKMPRSPWISIPINDQDLSLGYKDITYSQLVNAVKHAVHWLSKTLPSTSEPFQPFAYAGPKDLRYPILAVAAGKMQKVMVLPSAFGTPEAQVHVLSSKSCSVYIRPQSMAAVVDTVTKLKPSIQILEAPDLDELLQDASAEPVAYTKSWDDGKDDPWLVFHTSGTTSHPKPITYTHRMMAIVDTAAGLKNIEETHIHHYAGKRWYTPMPMLHFVGMAMVLSMSAYLRNVIVLGPALAPPSPNIIRGVLKYGQIDGALLVPSLIDALCLDADALASLRSLKYIHYAGAPLSVNSGQLLAPYLHRLVPSIGSTEAGGYFTKVSRDATLADFDYVAFQPHVGAIFEPRVDNLHELVFVRKPECEATGMQPIFMVYPEKDRHETNDLWIEHPQKKGLWKIVGRLDDYVYLAHGEGLHASTLEPEIERHEMVKAALVGGHGKPKPVLLVELISEAQDRVEGDETEREALLESLEPFLSKFNAQCHQAVWLDRKLVVIVKKEKPLVRTAKGSVARVQSLKLYENEIEEVYRKAGL